MKEPEVDIINDYKTIDDVSSSYGYNNYYKMMKKIDELKKEEE